MPDKKHQEWQHLTNPTDEYVNSQLAQGWRLWSGVPVVTRAENWSPYATQTGSYRTGDSILTTWHVSLFREIPNDV